MDFGEAEKGAMRGGSIIKSNTSVEEYLNKTRLFSAIHTIMYISKHQGTPALLEGTKSPSKDTGLAEPS